MIDYSPKASSSPPPAQLQDWQVKYFEDRGIAATSAIANGARHVVADEVKRLLGFTPRQPGSALGFFYPNAQPPFVRFRFEAGGYLTPRGAPIPIFFPFGQDSAVERLIVVESPTKSIALKGAGFLVAGLGGVATCLTKSGDLSDSWAAIQLQGRSVTILFDNDLHNSAVARALDRLARALAAAGAIVTFAALPRGTAKMGPDDFLKANGDVALRQLIDAAVPVHGPKRLALILNIADASERRSGLAALLADPVFIIGLLNGGPSEIAACRESFRKAGMATDFRAALSDGKKAMTEAQASCRDDTDGLRRYEAVDGALQSDNGTRLTNFVARILQDVESDDGAEVSHHFVVELVLRNGTNLGTIKIHPRDFLSTRWPTEKFGALVRVEPGPNSMREVADAIQALSEPERVKIFARTGWMEADGAPLYLMPEAAGQMSTLVQLPPSLSRYSFPSSAQDLQSALAIVQQLCGVAPDRISLPLVLAAFRAPLNSFLPADFAMHVHGTTGVLKSTLVAAVLSFFGEFTYNTLPASFSDTVASLELKANILRDAVLCVDELVVRSNSTYDEALNKANTLVRRVGNGAGRGRLDRNLIARPERPPHALVIMTGEQLPAGESILARTLSIAVQRGDVNRQVLSGVQANVAMLATFMKSYVEWLAPRLGLIKVWLSHRHRQLRGEFQRSETHLRAPSTIAHLLLGAELLLEFCEHQGLLVRGDADAFRERAERALVEATARQHEAVASANPGQLFLSVLADLLQSKAAHLGNANGSAPESPFARLVGWRAGGEIWLLPEAVFTAVAASLRERGEVMPVPAATLWRRLHDDGLVVVDSDGKPPKRSVAGQRRRVVVLRASALEAFCEPSTPTRRPDPPGWATAAGASAGTGEV